MGRPTRETAGTRRIASPSGSDPVAGHLGPGPTTNRATKSTTNATKSTAWPTGNATRPNGRCQVGVNPHPGRRNPATT
mgnify:CR=1 FL=1